MLRMRSPAYRRPGFGRTLILCCLFWAAGLAAASGQSLPAGWTSGDVGSPTVSGSASVSGSTWTVQGGGADIWGTADQFQFASRDLLGDASVVARVSSLQNTGTYPKAGVMLRSGTGAHAAYAFVYAGLNVIGFDCRMVESGTAYSAGSLPGAAAPKWIKLTRVGNNFAGYASDDGVTWTQIGGTQPLLMAAAMKAGLAVDSNNPAARNTGTFTGVSAAGLTSSRVNWAKYQTAWSDSAVAGHEPKFATDGVVNDSSSWQSSGTGPHWVGVTFPEAVPVGSVQLYLGNDDQNPIQNFKLTYNDGTGMKDLPGASFTGNAATVMNVVLPAAVNATQVMLYTTDTNAMVREIAVLPPNDPSGYPIGTDVTLNLAKKHWATASSWQSGLYPRRALDGYAGNDAGWENANTQDYASLQLDLQTTSRLGSVHLYSGSTTSPPVSSCALDYWNGSAWIQIQGSLITGNTQRERIITFAFPVTTSQLRVRWLVPWAQTLRELVVLPASTGITGFPIGTDVVFSEPPSTAWDSLADSYYTIFNRHSGGLLVAGTAGASEAVAFTTAAQEQYQVLYNFDSDTFRIRNHDTGQCLAAQNAGSTPGAAVVSEDYSARPDQLWRLVSTDNNYAYLVNVWSGLVLQTDSQTPATVTLGKPSGDWQQQWQLSFQAAYPKKGLADYSWQWARMGVSWNYNWSQGGADVLPANVVFCPQQWGTDAISDLPSHFPDWLSNSKPTVLLGYNEPDFTKANSGSAVATNVAADLWPQLEQSNLPIVSPAPAEPFDGWLGDFYGQANWEGYRVDYTGVHWYGYPNAGNLIGFLANIYYTWGRPVWLTEFSNVDWGKTQTWSEEDCYRFMTEFLWMAEDQPWLKRYAAFGFYADPPAHPWDHTAPTAALFKANGDFNAVGDVYAGWDSNRTVQTATPYIIHGKGSSFHLGNNGNNGILLDTIRANGTDMQWALMPTTANPFVVYIVSLKDGRRMRCNGNWIDLAPPSTTGGPMEWTYTAAGTGYYFLDNPATGTRLRLNRTNYADGSLNSVWPSLDTGNGATDDWVQFRFVKPGLPSSVQNLSQTFGSTWGSADIGQPAQAGYAYFDQTTGIWVVGGGGADILGQLDQFHYVSQNFTGDGTLITKVNSIQNTNQYAKAGLMFRDSTAVNAMYAHVFAGPGTVGFEVRNATGGNTVGAAYVGGTAPLWLKLVRSGNTFTAYYGTDGIHWTQLGAPQTVPMAMAALAGLSVTAHNAAALNTSTFSNVSFLPAGWSDQDIGGPAVSGGVSVDTGDGSWVVEGSGADISGTTDQFNFVSRDLAGDGSIAAQVLTLENTDPWAKAGVMLRNSTSASSMYAHAFITPGNGVRFECRLANGTVTNAVANVPGAAPAWVKLVRTGGSISAFYSQDGRTWTQFGNAQSIPMSPSIKAGLSLTAHTNATLNTATFSSVSLLPAGWSDGDIGSPGLPGSAVMDAASGGWTISGGGADVTGTMDQFHLVSRSLGGDSALVAQVGSIQDTDPWAKAGLMIRDSGAAAGAYAFVFLTPEHGISFECRAVAGTATSGLGSVAGSGPVWLKLLRSGNTFTAYSSPDGANWTQVGASRNITMLSTCIGGPAVTAHNNSLLNLSLFGNVAAGSLIGTPANLTATADDSRVSLN